jgi:transcription initiation factor TFIIIB Brf1 subunit/transcription initiation factor TFIIB
MSLNNGTCPECGSSVVINNVGETVCSSCGLVIDENRIKTEEEYVDKYVKMNRKTFNILSNSVIPGSYIQSIFPNNSLAKTNARSLGTNSTFLRGVELIKQVCDSLNLGKNVEKRSIFLLNVVLEDVKQRIELTVSSVVGAVVLFSIRESGLPVSFKEVFNTIKVKGKRVTASKIIKAYRLIIELIGYEPSRNTPEVFLMRIVNLLSASINSAPDRKEVILKELKQHANRCILLIPKQIISGKNPYVLAAGAVHYVFFKSGMNKYTNIRNTLMFSRLIHVTEYSLKEYSKIIEKYASSC